MIVCRRRWASFNTQPPEGGWDESQQMSERVLVSTLSRPKAAGKAVVLRHEHQCGFNTQPPEGGWVRSINHVCF